MMVDGRGGPADPALELFKMYGNGHDLTNHPTFVIRRGDSFARLEYFLSRPG